MDLLNSLFITIFGMSVVFIALVSLIAMINVQGRFVKFMDANQQKKAAAARAAAQQKSGGSSSPAASASSAASDAAATVDTAKSAPAALYSGPLELRLTGVDEKTAAMIMAIVCDESGIPANELYFKSIKALD